MSRIGWDRRWDRPQWQATIGSTNTELGVDPRPGRVLVAEHQSAGLGRRGRVWVAPPGASLAISVAIPAPVSPAAAAWVPLVTGLAVALALRDSRYAVPVQLKWPNDVLAPLPGPHGPWGKISGVLAHAINHPVHGPVIVVGTGLNVDQDHDQLSVLTATSWRIARGGAALPDGAREGFVDGYLNELLPLVCGLLDEGEGGQTADPARAAYRRLCRTIGQRVRVELAPGPALVGTAVEVADSGQLVVTAEDRREHRLSVGDVIHLRSGG